MRTLPPASFRHPVIDAALSTAATLLGMEVVFVAGIDEEKLRFERVAGRAWPGLQEGLVTDRTDSFCHRMLSGAAPATYDAASDPAYAGTPARKQLGVCSYVGVPIRRPDGSVAGTLCGIDRGHVAVDEAAVGVLRELAGIIAACLPLGDQPAMLIRRTPAGWAVGDGGELESSLTSAMVLADLLQDELVPGGRPPRPDGELDEVAQLRLAVSQLEHALAARVTVEQAIGILAERFALSPRQAFERLRRTARHAGLRVHDLSRDVVASVTTPATPLPAELGRA